MQRIPNDYKSLDVESAKKILRMIEEFEDIDDVQKVFHNLEMTEEGMAFSNALRAAAASLGDNAPEPELSRDSSEIPPAEPAPPSPACLCASDS